jgi:hypothetical protein
MFWIVGLALIASGCRGGFTPSGGEDPAGDPKVEGGHAAIYDTPRYNRFRCWPALSPENGGWPVRWSPFSSWPYSAWAGEQFFPTSDRPEVLVEVQMPYGTSIEQTSAARQK